MNAKLLLMTAAASLLWVVAPLHAAEESGRDVVQGKPITYKFESKPFPSPDEACRALLLEHNAIYVFKRAVPRSPNNTTQWDCAYKDGDNFGTYGTVEADLQCPQDSEPFEWTKRKLTCKCKSPFKASATQECEDPKVNDFKEAASGTGCNAIPYEDERKMCADLGRRKDDSCRDFECDREGVDKDLKTLKEKRANLQKAKLHKSPEQVPKLESAIADLVQSLTKRKSEASGRIARGSDCVDRREDVQKHFERVKQLVENESDSKLRPYVTTLVTHYSEGAKEHVRPIEEVKRASKNCEWVGGIDLARAAAAASP
jgi:hypothetical protein